MRLIHTAIISSLLLAASVAGCGDPCLPTIGVDTLITPAVGDVCFITTDDITSSGDTGSGVLTTGDACEAPLVDVFICAAMPSVGEMWGPCTENLSCAPGSTCIVGSAGNVCAPACDDCGCPNLGCFGGTCNAGASPSCVPACEAAGDPCPVVGMECAPEVGACVWPVVEDCSSAVGKVWWPCDNGACSDGSLCVDSGTAWICEPPCINDVCGADPFVCESEAANVPTCGTATTCHYDCTGVTECAPGQVCDGDLGQCMWPK